MYELEDKHWWFLAKRRFIKALLPTFNPHWQVLDLGCGTGGISIFLQKWGKVQGVEYSKDACQFLKKRGVNFTAGKIEDYKPHKNYYYLVCLLDVLYHRNIDSIGKVLNIAYKALKKDGLLLITDSAMPFLFSHHDKIMHAKKRFYLRELTTLVENAGFTIEKKSYTYFLIFPLFLLNRCLNKFIPFETVNDVYPLINTLLLSICKIEAKLLSIYSLPIGSSVIIKARKLTT